LLVIRTGLNHATKHIDEQQHRYRSDGDRDDGIYASKNMAHGTSKHNVKIAEKSVSLLAKQIVVTICSCPQGVLMSEANLLIVVGKPTCK